MENNHFSHLLRASSKICIYSDKIFSLNNEIYVSPDYLVFFFLSKYFHTRNHLDALQVMLDCMCQQYGTIILFYHGSVYAS